MATAFVRIPLSLRKEIADLFDSVLDGMNRTFEMRIGRKITRGGLVHFFLLRWLDDMELHNSGEQDIDIRGIQETFSQILPRIGRPVGSGASHTALKGYDDEGEVVVEPVNDQKFTLFGFGAEDDKEVESQHGRNTKDSDSS